LGKFIKKSGRIFGSFLAIVLILGLAVVLFLPMDKIKDVVVEKVELATGAEVSVGDASLRLFPVTGVRLSKGHVAGTGRDLAQATGSANNLENYDIQFDHLDVKVSLLPLFSKTLVVDAINLAGPVVHFQQENNEVSVENYTLAVTQLTLPVDVAQKSGRLSSKKLQGEKVPLGEQIPSGLAFDFNFFAGALTTPHNPFRDVSATGHMAHRILDVDAFEAKRARGLLAGGMKIDWVENSWGFLTFNFEVTDISPGALFDPLVKGMQERLDGTLGGKVAGRCNLKDRDTILETLVLAGNLNSQDGVLYARDLLHDAGRYIGHKQDLMDIRYQSLAHNFKVENGRYFVHNLKIDGLDTEWSCNGWFGLQGSMDLEVQVKLPPGFTPDLGQWTILAEGLRDSEGRIPLIFNLRGKASRPKVIVDLKAFGTVQEQVEAGAKAAIEDAAKKGLSEVLDKWKIR
jgi:uncharacterized protein involved in outer membrane biogenesis